MLFSLLTQTVNWAKQNIFIYQNFFFLSISPFSFLNILLLFRKFLLNYPTCCKGFEVKQYSKHSPIILYKNPSPICLIFAQYHGGCNRNLFWILQSLYIIFQIGACPSCQKHAQIPFIWKGVGFTQLTGLSGLWYHSYPFFSNTLFQVIPSQWIPVLDYEPSIVLACIFQTKCHLYFPTMCLISLDYLFFSAPSCA